MSWSAKDIALGTAIAGVVTAQAVTQVAPVTSSGSLNGVIKLTAASINVAGTITATVQTAVGSDWVLVKAVVIPSTAPVYVKWSIEVAADQSLLPLLSSIRVVITTTAGGDAITLSKVELLQG